MGGAPADHRPHEPPAGMVHVHDELAGHQAVAKRDDTRPVLETRVDHETGGQPGVYRSHVGNRVPHPLRTSFHLDFPPYRRHGELLWGCISETPAAAPRETRYQEIAYVGRRGSAPAERTPVAGSRRVTMAPMPHAPLSLTECPRAESSARVAGGMPPSTLSWPGW